MMPNSLKEAAVTYSSHVSKWMMPSLVIMVCTGIIQNPRVWGNGIPKSELTFIANTLLVRDLSFVVAGRSLALDPTNGYQCSRNIVDSALGSQQVELSGRVPRVQHLDPDSQSADGFPQLGAQRSILRSNAQNQQVRSRPQVRKQTQTRRRNVVLALFILQMRLAFRHRQRELPGPPPKGLAADEDDAGAVRDAGTAVEHKARGHANVDRRRGRGDVAEDVEEAETCGGRVAAGLLGAGGADRGRRVEGGDGYPRSHWLLPRRVQQAAARPCACICAVRGVRAARCCTCEDRA
jgi:hypothetical protein